MVTILDGQRAIHLRAVLFHVHSGDYLDITSEMENRSDGISFLTEIPGHLVFKTSVVADQLRLNIIDYHRLATLVESRPHLVDYYDDGYRLIITAGSLKIQELLQSGEGDKALFAPEREASFERRVPLR
jgi:hypothetical protein